MKFELSKKECDIIINGLFAISTDMVFKDNVVSGENMKMVGLGSDYSIKEVKPSVLKIINKLKV